MRVRQVSPSSNEDSTTSPELLILSVSMLVLNFIVSACDFVMQIAGSVAMPFLIPLSYFREDQVLTVIGDSFLTDILTVLNYIADYGLLIQLLQFSCLLLYNIPLHIVTAGQYTVSQHALNVV